MGVGEALLRLGLHPNHCHASHWPDSYTRTETAPCANRLATQQAMLYATEGIKDESDFDKPMVGVASVW